LLGLEGDQIDMTKDRFLTSPQVRLGVQLGEWGRRDGLWILKDHPGEAGLVTSNSSTFVAWNDLCHLYRPLRFGQVRGASWFAPNLLTAREVQDLMEAAVVQQRAQASFAGFIKRAPGGMNVLASKKDDEGKPVSRIEPGMIADIGDADIVFSNPSATSSFAEVYKIGMHAMAAGANITYDQITGDLTGANYSSLKAGKIEFRRIVEQVQWHIMAPRLCLPVTRRFTDRAILAGRLPKRRDGYHVDLIMPANEPIDAEKDLKADILAVRAGRMSPQEFISAWGRDWRKVLADTKAFFEKMDGEGVKLDIDGRRPANGAPSPDTKQDESEKP
jgi:lambda family phage portal protein